MPVKSSLIRATSRAGFCWWWAAWRPARCLGTCWLWLWYCPGLASTGMLSPACRTFLSLGFLCVLTLNYFQLFSRNNSIFGPLNSTSACFRVLLQIHPLSIFPPANEAGKGASEGIFPAYLLNPSPSCYYFCYFHFWASPCSKFRNIPQHKPYENRAGQQPDADWTVATWTLRTKAADICGAPCAQAWCHSASPLTMHPALSIMSPQSSPGPLRVSCVPEPLWTGLGSSVCSTHMGTVLSLWPVTCHHWFLFLQVVSMGVTATNICIFFWLHILLLLVLMQWLQ